MIINRFIFALFIAFTAFNAQAAPTNSFGLNVGIGLPFLGQVGAHYYFSENLNLSAGYNHLNLDVGDASAKLTMPEILLNYHPFAGSFFIGAGIGTESLEVTATDSATSQQAKATVDAITTIIKTGWMWGASDGGFWFGMDISYIMPSSPDTTITAPGVPPTSQAYIDTLDAADKFGETSYVNITFARLGWLF